MDKTNHKIAVVIPAYRVKEHILGVISKIPKSVYKIIIVDDHCPEKTGDFVRENSHDKRIFIIKNKQNLGVGGAVKVGYKAAINDDLDVVVKIDGDGQMNPELIPFFVEPIISGKADYTKGNRFYSIESLKQMPLRRVIGNIVLSFFSKFSSGYWNIIDPTNGYTAVSKSIINRLDTRKIHDRFFFESDMLFRLYTLNSKVIDIPMKAIYGNEKSNLKILNIMPYFIYGHLKNFLKRIVYKYYLRDFSIASLELLIGLIMTLNGVVWGMNKLFFNPSQIIEPTGTIVLNATLIIVGFQFLISFLNYDIAQVPKDSISNTLSPREDLL